MISSAIVMGITGIILTFLPEEIANYAGLALSDLSPLILKNF